MLRRLFGSTCVLVVSLLALGVGALPASASSGEGLAAQFHAELNAERAARGVAPLAYDTDVASAAAAWAQHLRGAGSLGHSSSGRAEIVGYGYRTGQVTDAWMGSASHRKLLVDANMTAVGIGVSCDGAGRIWVVAQFRQAAHGRPAPSASASPRVTPASSGGTCASGGGGNESAVRRLYAAFLHRPADPGGLATWTARSAAGESSASIGRMLAASPEFAARHAGLSDRDFVTATYRNVLRREPDPGGFDTWLHVARTQGRAAVLLGFAESAELRQLTGWG